MNETFRNEFLLIWELIKKYRVVILSTSFAAIMIVIIRTSGSFGLRYSKEVKQLLFFGILPLVFGMIITKKNPFKLGLGPGNYRFWIPASLLFIAVWIPILYIINILDPGIHQYYSTKEFDFWPSTCLMVPRILGWDYFIRGYLIFTLKDDMKEGGIVVSMIPAVILHIGKAPLEVVATIFITFLWGHICYRGNSFWPAFFMHMAINVFIFSTAHGYI